MFAACGVTRRGLTPAQYVISSTQTSIITSTHTKTIVRHFLNNKKKEEPKPKEPDTPVPTKQNPNYSSNFRRSQTTATKMGDDLRKTLPWWFPEWLIMKQVKWDYMYEHCRDQAELMIKELELKDTFQTWFEVTVLHLWIMFVRLRREPGGEKLSQNVFDSFWSEAEQRMYEYGSKNQLMFSRNAKHYSTIYHGAVLAYDEALIDNDMMMTDALWRNIFPSMDVSAEKLACVVKYVRRALNALEKDDEFMITGVIKFGDIIKPTMSYKFTPEVAPNKTN